MTKILDILKAQPWVRKINFCNNNVDQFLNQFVVDFGTQGTQILVDLSCEGYIYKRLFHKMYLERFLERIQEAGIDIKSMYRERGLDEIFYTDILDYPSPARIAEWKQQHLENNFTCKPCVKKLHEPAQCAGCGECAGVEYINWARTRKIRSSISDNEVLEYNLKSRPRSLVRVRFVINNGYEMVSRLTMFHYIAGRFCYHNENIYNNFYSIGYGTVINDLAQSYKWYVGGRCSFDIILKKENLLNEFQEVMSLVNRDCESLEITGLYEDSLDNKIELYNDGYMSYIFSMGNELYQRFLQKYDLFDGVITLPSRFRGSSKGKEVEFIGLKERTLSKYSHKRKCGVVFVSLPYKVHPYRFISQAMRRSFDKTVSTVGVSLFDAGKEFKIYACKCGKTQHFSYIYNKMKNTCMTCEGQTYLQREY